MPPPDVVLARLDGAPITLREFLEHLRLEDGLLALRRLVERRIVSERAAAEGAAVAEAELQQAAESWRVERSLFRAADFESFLAASKLGLEDFLSRLEGRLLREKLSRRIVPEAEVEGFFQQNRLEYDRARLSRIVLGEEGLAREIAASLGAGGARSFAELAARHSLREEEARAGGYVGLKSRGEIPPELEVPVFSAKAGSLAGPVAVEQEQHLLWVHEILPARLDEDIRSRIRSTLFERWLEAQYRNSRVETEF